MNFMLVKDSVGPLRSPKLQKLLRKGPNPNQNETNGKIENLCVFFHQIKHTCKCMHPQDQMQKRQHQNGSKNSPIMISQILKKLIALYTMSLMMKIRSIRENYSNFDMHTSACACTWKQKAAREENDTKLHFGSPNETDLHCMQLQMAQIEESTQQIIQNHFAWPCISLHIAK